MAKLTTQLGRLTLQNPVLTASGTFGFGNEYQDFIDIDQLGGFVVKGTTLLPREGNPYPRMAETPSGMLNAVGLQNKGVDYFIEHIHPFIPAHPHSALIVNVSGSVVSDYVETIERLEPLTDIAAIELNISCPNVKAGGMGFGTRPELVEEVVGAARKACKDRHLMVKLTPNVTDICEIARAAEAAGADSVSLINTLLGMAIDVERRRPMLSTVTGGLSGPCIRPVALRMVYQVHQAVRIPIVGMGGITSSEDAVAFLLAGASAVEIGTANFVDPTVSIKVIEGINDYLCRHEIESVEALSGGLII